MVAVRTVAPPRLAAARSAAPHAALPACRRDVPAAPPLLAASRRLLLAAAAAALATPQPRAALALAPPGAAELADAALGFRLAYPADWSAAPKPVKTHQYEALLEAPAPRGVKLGLTVDPVKIDSLEQFGTLATVTDRVLTVEEGRDGVTDVKLRGAAEERPAGTLYYAIVYEVTSSRGKKVYLCRYAIARGRLFVLQLQAPADTWDADAGVRDALGAVAASLEVAS